MLREKEREYAKVSNMAMYGGMGTIVIALLFGLISVYTSYDFEFTAVMVALIAVCMFLLGNYAVTVATSKSDSEEQVAE